jgi:hypothetical protein
LRLFFQGHQCDAEISLDDIHGIVQCMQGESLLELVLALVLGFVRNMLERAVATEASFGLARALILLRCLELVYLHVGHFGMLAAVREIFKQMERLLKSAAQRSCLVAGLVDWLSMVLEREKLVSLAHCVLVKARERKESIKAEGTEVEMVPHEECLIMVRGSELKMSIAFVWPCGFRLTARQGIEFVAGDEVAVVPMERQAEVKRLFGDAVRRMRITVRADGGRKGFVDS